MTTRNPVPIIRPELIVRATLAFPAINVQKQLETEYVEPVKVAFRDLADTQGAGFTYEIDKYGSIKVALGAPPRLEQKVKVAPGLSPADIADGVAQGYLVVEDVETTGRLGAVTFTPVK